MNPSTVARLPWLALALMAPSMAAARAPAPPMVDYAVRKGDNLYTLAQLYFDRLADAETVRRLNHVADPYRLRPGSTLHIPLPVLRQQLTMAHVEAFSGPVEIGMAGRRTPAVPGMAVGETGTIQTGVNAFLTLRLADGSTVSIPSQSRVTISRMRKVLLTGAVERLFEVEAGRARMVVTPMGNRASSFRLSTPVAIAAVRGTEFRIDYDPGTRTHRAGVLEGKVDVANPAARSDVLVPAGFGAVTRDGGTGDLVPLLPAPALDDPGRTQNGRQLAFAIRPQAGAEAYQVEVARDAGFLDRVEEARSKGTAVSLPPLPTGTYFVRVEAVDGNGLEGLPNVYGFERRLNMVSGSMDSGKAGHVRRYRFRWYGEGEGARQFRFQLSTHDDGSRPIIDEPGVTGNELAVTNLPGGDYYWRVMSVLFAGGKAEGAWSPIQHFHIETR